MVTLESELQKIYDSEIHVSISWMWDGGIDVKLGTDFGGFDEEGNVKSASEILAWLQDAIGRHYRSPGITSSAFASEAPGNKHGYYRGSLPER